MYVLIEVYISGRPWPTTIIIIMILIMIIIIIIKTGYNCIQNFHFGGGGISLDIRSEI